MLPVSPPLSHSLTSTPLNTAGDAPLTVLPSCGDPAAGVAGRGGVAEPTLRDSPAPALLPPPRLLLLLTALVDLPDSLPDSEAEPLLGKVTLPEADLDGEEDEGAGRSILLPLPMLLLLLLSTSASLPLLSASACAAAAAAAAKAAAPSVSPRSSSSWMDSWRTSLSLLEW